LFTLGVEGEGFDLGPPQIDPDSCIICLSRHPVSVTYSIQPEPVEASLPRPIVQEVVIKASIEASNDTDQQKQPAVQPRRPRQAPYPPRPMLRPTGTPAPAPRKQGKQPSA
jgi:hypothetical protein